MRRISMIAVTLAAAALILSQALAQTTETKRKRHHFIGRAHPAPQRTLTPAQRDEVKHMNVVFTACKQKATVQGLHLEERRAFMRSCLRTK